MKLTNYIFINKHGKYLQWSRKEKSGFVAGCAWDYQWVNSIHAATVGRLPAGRINEWFNDDNPVNQVVASLPAKVTTTRVVELLENEDD